MLYIGADHQGYELKERLKKYLMRKKIRFQDLGVFHNQRKVDYPDYAFHVGKKVAEQKGGRGLLICGSGVGMVVAANKIKGARAGQADKKGVVVGGRRDDDMNILVLSSWTISLKQAKNLLNAFLGTSFSPASRFRRRLKKIQTFENIHWK